MREISELNPGAVKFGDVKWSAKKKKKDAVIAVNSIVEVLVVNGNKLIVKKVEDKK